LIEYDYNVNGLFISYLTSFLLRLYIGGVEMLLLIFLVFFACNNYVSSIEIVDHYKTHVKEGIGLNSDIPIEDRIEFICVVVITNFDIPDENVGRRLIEKIENNYIIEKDHCDLIRRLYSNDSITLRVHCNTTTEHDTNETILEHTIQHIVELFGRENVLIEKDQIIRKPHSVYASPIFNWYGRREHLDKLINIKLNNHHPKNKPFDDDDDDDYILMPDTTWPIFVQDDVFWWGLDRIDQRFGWKDSKYSYYNMASDVDIYIIDTGIRITHNDFGGRAFFLVNTVGDGKDDDCNGHGTHVAGIAGSTTYGVTKNSTLFAAKALDCTGGGDLFTIRAAIDAVIQNVRIREGTTLPKKKRSVVNLSLGGTKSDILDQAVLALAQNGIFVSVSAGNSDSDACNFSPANLGGNINSGVMSVAASDVFDSRTSFSNFGYCVSISASGKNILSLWNTDDSSTNVLDGTSMSSPFVAGVGALVLQSNLDLTIVQVSQLINKWSTKNIVYSTTYEGGGKNLLFSLVKYDDTPPTDSPTTLPPPVISNSHKIRMISLHLILLILLMFIMVI
jgi:hypothetical protein